MILQVVVILSAEIRILRLEMTDLTKQKPNQECFYLFTGMVAERSAMNKKYTRRRQQRQSRTDTAA